VTGFERDSVQFHSSDFYDRGSGVVLTDVATPTSDRLATAFSERLEGEVLAAWRMDYDFLYVCHHARVPRGSGTERGNASFSYSMTVIPSNSKRPPDVRETAMDTAEEYDLRDVTCEQIQEVRDRGST